MSISDTYVNVYCDEPGCTASDTYEIGTNDVQYVRRKAERDGWVFDADEECRCADCHEARSNGDANA